MELRPEILVASAALPLSMLFCTALVVCHRTFRALPPNPRVGRSAAAWALCFAAALVLFVSTFPLWMISERLGGDSSPFTHLVAITCWLTFGGLSMLGYLGLRKPVSWLLGDREVAAAVVARSVSLRDDPTSLARIRPQPAKLGFGKPTTSVKGEVESVPSVPALGPKTSRQWRRPSIAEDEENSADACTHPSIGKTLEPLRRSHHPATSSPQKSVPNLSLPPKEKLFGKKKQPPFSAPQKRPSS